MGKSNRTDRIRVVVARHEGVGHGRFRHTRRIGQAERRHAGTGLYEEEVGVAETEVEAALSLGGFCRSIAET